MAALAWVVVAVSVVAAVMVDDDTHCCLPLVQNGLNFLDPYIGYLQHGYTRKSAWPPQSPHPGVSGCVVPLHSRTHPELATSIIPQQ